MTTQLDEGLAMARFAYYGIVTAEDEQEAAMITANTPGAYHLGKSRKKGYHKRIDLEEVEALRQQGLSYSQIAARLDVTIPAIKWQQRKRRQESKITPEGQR